MSKAFNSSLVEITAVHPEDAYADDPRIVGLRGRWQPGSPEPSRGHPGWWAGEFYVEDTKDTPYFYAVQYQDAFTDADRFAFLKEYRRCVDVRMDGTALWSVALPTWVLPRARSLEEAIDLALKGKANV